ncbi:VOC family protein [Flectobacillus longus]|uniref:VOC family protein n=1 Tax=Flectobacillus longus TaxID=2984207 RepID=UPI0024B8486A|nr:VOC family protein [Flectobacillus longus]MDI9879986.1 VOC family protein [Flectobacillus longus]
MKIKEINHAALFVKNLQTSKEFYGNVLELPEVPRPNFDFEGVWYALGRHTLHLIAGRTDEIIVSGSRRNHLALEVEDIQECEAFLKVKKIPMVGPKMRPDGVPQIFIQDPDGYWIEFTLSVS